MQHLHLLADETANKIHFLKTYKTKIQLTEDQQRKLFFFFE